MIKFTLMIECHSGEKFEVGVSELLNDKEYIDDLASHLALSFRLWLAEVYRLKPLQVRTWHFEMEREK